MKPTNYCFQLFPVLVAGLMLLPLSAQAQEPGAEPAHKEVQRDAPNPQRIEAMIRELQELHRAGKAEEARPIAEHLRAIAKENPQLVERVRNAMQQPEGPQRRPNAERQTPPSAQPKAEGQERPMAQPKPERPQPPQTAEAKPERPQRQAAQPKPERQRRQAAQPRDEAKQARPMAGPRMRGGWGPQMAQPNAAEPKQPMVRPNIPGAPPNPMMGPGMRGGWGPQMAQPNAAEPPQPMVRPNIPCAPPNPLMGRRMRGGWGPQKVQPQPMVRPGAAGPERPAVRPNVRRAQVMKVLQAEPSQVARIRHLRQAAMHLAAAGYTEHAAKARNEIGRLAAELKQSKAGTPAPADKAAPRERPRGKDKPDKNKPEAARAPDANAAMLMEMRKLHQQIAEINARMQKLEAR